MAFTVPRTSFAIDGMVLDRTTPPTKPPAKLGFGSCCFRADVEVKIPEVPGWSATVRGYDSSPQIAKDAEEACRAYARASGQKMKCGEASLIMLRNSNVSCDGRVYLENGDVTTRIA